MSTIAIIGMACRYPQARSPRQLWENALAQRQAFRRIPRARINLDDYGAAAEDRISTRMAALLEDYEFDRARFHISKDTFLSTDLTHWLALETAARALEDARLQDADESWRERTGVYVGNSLTGEFARANLMRLRWPYVRRILGPALQRHFSGGTEDLARLLAEIESIYKAPFPATTEDSLAGGLSNTIAGRICNYFDLKGGGYTVDGACASSLLAVTTACSALESGEVDVAIAGGVDLSLDPFELAGFSKLGALAADRMRVFDARPTGFLPGEGCGMVALMRHEDALGRQIPVYAVIRGWGISSDGSGGITRPESDGQALALRRAYQRAGYGIESVAYFECHGTGTAVGDTAELQALSKTRQAAAPSAPPAAIGSIKANIGHTKAAAGIAGLIKTAMALHAQVIPPTTGCDRPHAELTGEQPALRILREGELWPATLPLRAGVSAMGFGGINTHIALESSGAVRRARLAQFEKEQLSTGQDCELFVFQAANAAKLACGLEEALERAGGIAFGEMPDFAAALAQTPEDSQGAVRAACVAATPEELEASLRKLHSLCLQGEAAASDTARGIFLGSGARAPRIGLLFPGQGSPIYTSGGIWARRFAAVRELYERAGLPETQSIATETAQPCIVTASLAGLHALKLLGIEASVALGHSLGEITALGWAGAIEAGSLITIAASRGRIMAEMGEPSGAMASVRCDWQSAQKRLNGDRVVIAAKNSPAQTVISGEAQAVRRLTARMAAEGTTVTMLPVSHAFHSPLVEGVARAFSDYLSSIQFGPLRRRVVSTVTGAALDDSADLRALLSRQITEPVLFSEALALAAAETDLFIEAGPGSVLAGIVPEVAGTPVISLNAGDESLRGLLLAAGAAFAMGAEINLAPLFDGRFIRPFDVHHRPSFLRNPCESAPEEGERVETSPPPIAAQPEAAQAAPGTPVIEVLLNLVARRTELPLTSIKRESRFLDDLHLNSIAISQIILEAAGELDLDPPAAPAEYTNTTIEEAAQSLESLRHRDPARAGEKHPRGAGHWVRALAVDLVEQAIGRMRTPPGTATSAWQVAFMDDCAFAEQLKAAFQAVPGAGVVCCVPPERDDASALFLLETAQSALRKQIENIVFIQHNGGVSALARSLYLERPAMTVTVVDAPAGHPEAASWAAAEACAAHGFTEAHYSAEGVRREPRLRVLWPEESGAAQPLGPEDVLLVTGGGKGIAAECALEAARHFGCRLALAGRSDPDRDPELRQNLMRFTDAGVHFRYFSADIADPGAAGAMLGEVESQIGPVTAILHGAGTNHPMRMDELTAAELRGTLAPKLSGLRNVLSGVDASKLRMLITFGSIIARTGLHGEAHYGLANEWLAHEADGWRRQHPECRCLNLEWSVWAGAGMGQRLGVLESLARQGIEPLPLEEAIHNLIAMLKWEQAPVSSILTGRFGNPPTLQFAANELPLLRFLEQVKVYYPGIELIADADLNTDTDPYVAEHAFQGEQLIPAVIAMEAMTQAAMALEGSADLPELHQLRFDHPLVVPRDRPVTMRVAALRQGPGVVTVAVRCSTTSFQVDHFSGECVFASARPAPPHTAHKEPPLPAAGLLTLDPSIDLYGNALFHQGRFRRVAGYHLLHATRSMAELAPPVRSPWYARHLPSEFAMGDPASRDAAIHCLQACIPHKTVLPVGVGHVAATRAWTRDKATIHAVERARDGSDFLFDLWIRDREGRTCEKWESLHLRAVAPIGTAGPWPLPLLAPYLERKLDELLPPCGIKVRLLDGTEDARERAMLQSIRQSVCPAAKMTHRPDGKPEILGCSGRRTQISCSHSGRITMLAFRECAVGCDLENIAGRGPSDWKGLLDGGELDLAGVLSDRSHASMDCAATQVWALRESLRKAGAGLEHRLRLDSCAAENWALFSSPDFLAATFHARIADADSPMAFGFVMRKKQ